MTRESSRLLVSCRKILIYSAHNPSHSKSTSAQVKVLGPAQRLDSQSLPESAMLPLGLNQSFRILLVC
jgi:hypothetical protein